ncbi:hypothetical protein KM043_009429 [Ampulex compressa]|nr:hypothetical protein KM043_009429 [Ampulex compressa]
MGKDSCEYKDLKYDESCVVLRASSEESSTWLYSLSSDCVLCPYTRVSPITSEINTSVTFNTVKPVKWRVLDTDGQEEYLSAKNTSNIICELSPNLGQFGLYDLVVENGNCLLKTIKEPTKPYTELFIAIGALVCILLAASGMRSLFHCLKKKCAKHADAEPASKGPVKRRIKAIDTFRGASTLLMIFINNGSGGYPTLGHATWNGLLLGDLVFPCFIWIMGVCIPVALSSQIKRGVSKYAISYSIVKRSFLLFLIGVALNTVGTGAQVEEIRIFGVLQRFGVTYLVVGLSFLYFMPKKTRKMQTPILREVQDVITLFPQWCLMIVILLVHSGITFGLAIPGCPIGYLGPGGLHDDGMHRDCAGGSAGYIDRSWLKEAHLYQKSGVSSVYKSGPFDAEGILGCLTSIFHVFLGVQAGVIMMSYKDWKERVIRWLLWAVLFGCVGCALHFTNAIPVNKNLWSLSFVFVTTSFALAFLSGCYLLVDVTRIWRGGPFRIPGMNALVLYVGHILCYRLFPFHWKIGSMHSRALVLAENIWGVALWTIIAYMLHRKRTYITL